MYVKHKNEVIGVSDIFFHIMISLWHTLVYDNKNVSNNFNWHDLNWNLSKKYYKSLSISTTFQNRWYFMVSR